MTKMNIDENAIRQAVVDQVSDQLMYSKEGLADYVRSELKSRIDKVWASEVQDQIGAIVQKEISDGFNRQYQKVDNWGDQVGEPTTIKAELQRLVTSYWQEKVDARNGQKSDSYGAITRAEYTMMRVCSKDFSEQANQEVANMAGALKDGLRLALHETTNKMLNEVFKVKSLGDKKP